MKHFVVTNIRFTKARKIESVIQDFRAAEVSGLDVLDIGCGNGEIAEYFTTQGNTVRCVDIEDQRVGGASGYFALVQDENLPFKDGQFDVVISNHVIEHVGDHKRHISEIFRVLKDGGTCYLATPNRIFPYEVHYKLFLLHWLPNRIFIALLKLIGKYQEPLYLLTHGQMKRLIGRKFSYVEYTDQIACDPDKYNAVEVVPKFMVGRNLRFLNKMAPTNVFALEKRESSHS